MQRSLPSPIRHRWALLVLALFALAAAAPLLLAPGATDANFAFGLGRPATAAFLGACFLAGAAALLTAWREDAWGGAAVLGPGVFAATGLTMVVTIGELGGLHLPGPAPVARAVAWAWLAASVLAPAGWLALVFLNDRRWSADPPDRRRIPDALAVLIGLQSLVLLGAGAWVFISPQTAPWPWQFGDPGGRLAGAWIVAAGLTGLSVLVERDEGRTRPAFAGCLALGLFLLLAAWLSRPDLPLSIASIAYVAFALSLLVSGASGLRRGVRDVRPRAAPFVR